MTAPVLVDRINQRVFIGLDLGQSQDYTALVGVRKVDLVERMDERDEQLDCEAALLHCTRPIRPWNPVKVRTSTYEVGHIERVPLGTSYPEIVRYVAGLTQRRELVIGGRRPVLVLDTTGVGAAVFDLFVQAGLDPMAITITAGREAHHQRRGMTVPKRDAVAALLVALQAGRLTIASALPEAILLVEELLNFQVRLTDAGHDTYGAARESVHDDLVLALACAVWVAARHQSSDPDQFVTLRY